MTLTRASSFIQQHHPNRVQAEDSHGLAPSSSSTILTAEVLVGSGNTQCGWRNYHMWLGWGVCACLCVERDRDDVKNESATEQSQILVFRITIVINLGVSSITWHSHGLAPSSSSTILTESRLKKALSVDEETTTCGWGEVCVCACASVRGGRGQKWICNWYWGGGGGGNYYR